MRNDCMENEISDIREENKKKRRINTDPYYPNYLHEADITPEEDEQNDELQPAFTR